MNSHSLTYSIFACNLFSSYLHKTVHNAIIPSYLYLDLVVTHHKVENLSYVK